ncbi:MAG: ATP-binding protein [Bacteroidetes bacterium]|nr:ATP-binding protein [Bacteroidota bacterium]
MDNKLTDNARDLNLELEWFADILNARLNFFFEKPGAKADVLSLQPSNFSQSSSFYGKFVTGNGLIAPERLILILALIPHIRPQLLDVLWIQNRTTERGFTEFGGLKGVNHSGFIPTGETAAFIIAGEDLTLRFETTRIFEGGHFFAKQNVLSLAPATPGEPMLSGALLLSGEYLNWFVTGIERKPNFNSEFPAKLIETSLSWEHLVLPVQTLDQLEEIRHWILHGNTLLNDWGMGQKLNPGYTTLFYGPPGTGKTFSACLLGNHCGCDVYKIDLSMIISKYIGETEKNLSKIFDMAENKNWILFFDEADALFGKRSKVEDAHDRYANQEISYLLQRIEDFNGVVILASNFKNNIDAAFLRRFQSVIQFPMPKPAERSRIWKNAFSTKALLEKKLDLDQIAEKHEISGGTIMNVVRTVSLKAISRNDNKILLADVEEAIRREFLKEGRTI